MNPDSTNQPSQPPAPMPEAAASPLPNVPDSWPGAFGLYKYSKQAIKLNLGTIVVLWLLSVVVTIPLQILLKIPGQVIGILFGSLITAAYTMAYIAGVREQHLSLGQALSQALPLWLKMIGLSLLVFISVAVSIVLLIIPAFFVIPRLSLAIYFLVDKKLGVVEAYKASWAATKGQAIRMWGIIGVNLLMGLLVLTIIGIPFAIYFLIMYSAAFAVAYEFINKAQPEIAATPVTSAQPIQDTSSPIPAPTSTDTLPPTPSAPPTV